MLTVIAVYMFIGIFAGLLAGLLGVGGGLIIVPLINYSFAVMGIASQHTHVIALGTSLATIMFTSVSSFMAHHRNGAVIWPIFAHITPGILVGTFFGSYVASIIPIGMLKIFFVCFLYYTATQMFLNAKPKPTRTIPGLGGNSIAGGIIGIVSSLVGIGGGSLSVPYMTWCNVPIHKAIGTSAAIGFPIAVAGAAGYMLNGLGVEGRPEYTLGFVYLPALLGISLVSVFTAPIGARLSKNLPVTKLKRCFACLLLVIGTQMLYTIVTA